MWALLITTLLATGAPSPLEMARDRQDRAALQKMAGQYEAAAARTPNDGAAQYRLALACSYMAEVAQQQRDKKQAQAAAVHGIAAAEKAVALKPEAENYRLLGTLYAQAITDLLSGLSYGPRAKEAINKAVEKAPRVSQMYVTRGVGNYYVPAQLGGGTGLAIADFRKAIELDARNADAWLWLGIALRKDNKDAEARQALSKTLELDPNRVWARQELDKIPAK
jgi:tetratricopeptide (TPR) repeat protein